MTPANLITSPSFPAVSPDFITDVTRNKRTVLVVEDDGAVRRYLQITLERSGFEVVTARDGLDATNKLLSNSVSAVVTDAIMPRMTGYDLCRFLRRSENFSSLPIVLLSGLEHEDYEDGHDEEKANVCLAKPVSPDNLICQLERLLSKSA